MNSQKRLITMLVAAAGLLILPLVLQGFGNAWVRIADMALLFVLLSLGLNIVVGYAGLLDLGYVAFFAIGAYMFGLLASPQLTDAFPVIAAWFPNGLHTPLWMVVPMAAGLAGLLGILLGAPTLRLRGDYLAIVTLGFGEIIRVFLNNLDHPVNITNGPRGISQIDYSVAGRIANGLAVVVKPIGFNRDIALALIPAMAAREVAVSALATVYAINDGNEVVRDQSLGARLKGSWPLPTALAFLAWFVFAPQCISTIAVVRRETNGWKWPLFMVAYLFALAYVAAGATFWLATYLGL